MRSKCSVLLTGVNSATFVSGVEWSGRVLCGVELSSRVE